MTVEELLLMNFEEDKSQRPEFGIGFEALRLSEMRELCAKFETPERPMDLSDATLDVNNKKQDAVNRMNSWYNQGYFPEQTKMTLAQEVLAEMTPEMLRAALDEKEQAGVGGITGTAQLGPGAGLPENKPEVVVVEAEDYSDREKYPWPTLKSIASARGIELHHKISRMQVEDALTALDQKKAA